jgi:hypothetical protein
MRFFKAIWQPGCTSSLWQGLICGWALLCFINEPVTYSVFTFYRSLSPQYGSVNPVSASFLFGMLPSHSLSFTPWQQLSRLGQSLPPRLSVLQLSAASALVPDHPNILPDPFHMFARHDLLLATSASWRTV